MGSAPDDILFGFIIRCRIGCLLLLLQGAGDAGSLEGGAVSVFPGSDLSGTFFCFLFGLPGRLIAGVGFHGRIPGRLGVNYFLCHRGYPPVPLRVLQVLPERVALLQVPENRWEPGNPIGIQRVKRVE